MTRSTRVELLRKRIACIRDVPQLHVLVWREKLRAVVSWNAIQLRSKGPEIRAPVVRRLERGFDNSSTQRLYGVSESVAEVPRHLGRFRADAAIERRWRIRANGVIERRAGIVIRLLHVFPVGICRTTRFELL